MQQTATFKLLCPKTVGLRFLCKPLNQAANSLEAVTSVAIFHLLIPLLFRTGSFPKTILREWARHLEVAAALRQRSS